jgi:type II secretory pathway pseudopilin PulG
LEPVAQLAQRCRGEAGHSMLEIVVLVAIVAVLVTGAVQSVSQDAGRVHADALRLRSLVAEVRTLAASVGPFGAPTGATLVLVNSANGARASVYAGRPIAAYSAPPVSEPNLPALVTSARVVVAGDGRTNLGFSLFVSSSGHASYAPWFPGMPSLAREPPCTSPGFLVEIGDAIATESHRLTCEDARLEQ